MAAKQRAKRPAPQVPVPQSAADADDAIRIIGECQRQLALLQAAQDEQLAAVKARCAEQAAPYQHEAQVRTEGLQVWCEAHRSELTQGGRVKTVQFAAGTISWRSRPPSVRLRDIEGVISRIRALGLYQFLRTRVEIDKEAMLKEPEAAAGIDGVLVGSAGEDFVVAPFEAPLGGEGADKGGA